ncbi:MAG TPA: GxxExxY protein [Bacteroidia bacterium]
MHIESTVNKQVITQKYINDLTYEVIGAAIHVHKTMGKGLLESVYHCCLKEELKHHNINYETELIIPVKYRDKTLDVNFRCDLFIEKCLVLELKSVKEMPSIFEAQLLTYMKLLQAPKGILVNFFCDNIFKEGQKTIVNEYFELLPKS